MYDNRLNGSRCLLDGVPYLLADLLHAGHGGVAPLLVDVVQTDVLDAVIATDALHRLSHFGGKLGVGDVDDAGVGIELAELAHQVAEGGTEGVEILLAPSAEAVLPHGHTGPTVIGAAEDEEHLGTTQAMDAGDECTVGEVLPLVARMADSGAGIGVVGIELHGMEGGQQMPPGLLDAAYVVLLLSATVGTGIPAGIGFGRDVAAIRGIGITKDGEAELCLGMHSHAQQEKQDTEDGNSFHRFDRIGYLICIVFAYGMLQGTGVVYAECIRCSINMMTYCPGRVQLLLEAEEIRLNHGSLLGTLFLQGLYPIGMPFEQLRHALLAYEEGVARGEVKLVIDALGHHA